MISVVVTEYNKRGFLKDALYSAFNQTLNKEKYEVIVIKKEKDPEVDEFAVKHGAKIIYDDTAKFGGTIYNALLEAKGDIISLLEDDDIYAPNKLEEVYKIFNSMKVGGARNNFHIIDANGRILKKYDNMQSFSYLVNNENYNHLKYFYNLGGNSAISIRRELINDDIKNIELACDIYLAFSAICSETYSGYLIFSEPLTLYRVHSQNNSNPKSLEHKVNFSVRSFQDHKKLYEKFGSCSKEVNKTLKFLLLNYKLSLYFLDLYLSQNHEHLIDKNEINFSAWEKLFIMNPTNNPISKYTLKVISAGLFLFLPPIIRENFLKYLYKSKTITKRNTRH